jgi:hypothetical protein
VRDGEVAYASHAAAGGDAAENYEDAHSEKDDRSPLHHL